MHLKETADSDVQIFGLSCEIDVDYAPRLRAMFRRKIEARCKALILDLTDVYHIDSAALVTFIDYYREAAQHGGVLCLCGVNEGLRPVFDTMKQGALLPIFVTVADAVAALKCHEIQPYGTLSWATDESSAIALRELARG